MSRVKSYLLELLAATIFDLSDDNSSYETLLLEFFTKIDTYIEGNYHVTFHSYYQQENARKFEGFTVNDPADPSYNVVSPNTPLKNLQNYCRYSKNRDDWGEIFYK